MGRFLEMNNWLEFVGTVRVNESVLINDCKATIHEESLHVVPII